MEQQRPSFVTRRSFVKLLAGGAFVAVGLVACSQASETPSGAASGSPAAAQPTKAAGSAPTTAPATTGQKKVIKIGLIHPFTGNWAVAALAMKQAAEMRAEEIQEADKGVEFQILSEDDGVKPEQGIAAATKLVQQDKVSAILGAVNSNVTVAIVPTLMKLEVPHITMSLSPKITQLGSPYVFRLAVTDAKGQKQLAEYVVKKKNHQKIAIIFTNDEFGRSSSEAQRDALKGLGLEPVAVEAFNLGEEDVTGQLTRIKTSGATALSLNPGAPDSARVAIQVQRLGLKLQMYGASHLASPNFLDLAKDAAEGIIMVSPFYDGIDDPTIQQIVKKFTERAKLPMDSWAATNYDGVESYYQAVKKGGSTDPKAIAKWLHENGNQGTLIKGLKWDKDGEALYNQHILEVKSGKLALVEAGGPIS